MSIENNKFNDVLRTLSENNERVVDEALKASKSFYLPIKGFPSLDGSPDEAGAVIVTENGKIHARHVSVGGNQWKEYATIEEVIQLIENTGGGGGGVFTDTFTIYQQGNPLGLNGTLVPAGTKVTDFLKSVFVQSVPPTANLTLSSSSKPFNEINFSITCNLAATINTPGTTIVNWKLDFSRDNSNWTTLLNTGTYQNQFNHDLQQTTPNNNTIYYRLTVTDNNAKVSVSSRQMTFLSYQGPSITIQAGNTQREKGNIYSNILGTITKVSQNTTINTYKIQVNINNGGWNDLTSEIAFTTSAINYIHNNIALVQANTIAYRIVVVDNISTTVGPIVTINFSYCVFFGPTPTISVNPQDPRNNLNSVLVNSFGTSRTFGSGTTHKIFEIIIPLGYMIDSVFDKAIQSFITSDYTLVNTNFLVNDYTDTPRNGFYLYRLNQSVAYNPEQEHEIKIKTRV